MKVKAILVTGGHGSRLYPFTKYTQKTLLPLYDRPVIDYALGTIRRAGINDITIIANQFIGQIAKHIGSGLPGERIHYVLEEKPEGVAKALSIARPHNENCRLMIYFSDNITTLELKQYVDDFQTIEKNPGCVLLARKEDNPHSFGVAKLNDKQEIIDIVEKPKNPPSNLAIGGIYLYDETFWSRLDSVVEDKGSGFSISDINRSYVREGAASIIESENSLWIDCGTPDALVEASHLAEKGVLSPEPCNYRDGDSPIRKN